ncbi:MAG: S49 family peptidase [Patescibacteria group bacterium]
MENQKPTKNKIKSGIIYIVIIIILILFVPTLFGYNIINFTAEEEEICGNVAGIELHGDLVTYISPENYDEDGYPLVDQTASEDITAIIEDAESNDDIEAIILEVDSVGGGPVAAEEVAKALKAANKPTVALIREYGDSAAYYAATGADRIFASENSDVGSIGVTMSYLDYSQQNVEDGIIYQEISSGKFKNTGDPDKPLSDEEKAYLQRDTMILHENFVKAVSANRGLDIEKVRELADGSSMPGEMALDNGLIDQIGGMDEIADYLDSQYDMDTLLCWY